MHNPKHVSVTLVSKFDHIWYALMCYRGVPGKYYGKLISQGGSIDHGGNCDAAARRELKEEAGVILETDNIDGNKLKLIELYSTASLLNYYCITPNSISVKGPSRYHEWEVIQDGSLISDSLKLFMCILMITERKNTLVYHG